ncbi:MAG: hypothetical protein ACSLEY_03140 [Candidatus Saccharimonadales bacterium]
MQHLVPKAESTHLTPSVTPVSGTSSPAHAGLNPQAKASRIAAVNDLLATLDRDLLHEFYAMSFDEPSQLIADTVESLGLDRELAESEAEYFASIDVGKVLTLAREVYDIVALPGEILSVQQVGLQRGPRKPTGRPTLSSPLLQVGDAIFMIVEKSVHLGSRVVDVFDGPFSLVIDAVDHFAEALIDLFEAFTHPIEDPLLGLNDLLVNSRPNELL